MKDYIILIVTCFFVASAGLLGGMFTQKNGDKKGAVPYYTVLYMIAALIGWGILYAFHFSFEPGALFYSAIFGVCFAGVNITLILAVRSGPVSLTNLIVQLSLIATALWGLFFWGSEWNYTVLAGLILVVAALALIMIQKGKGEKITVKWVVYSLVSFLFNAGCAISQKSHMIAYDGQHGTMMMFFAVVISTVISVVWCIIDRPESPKEIFRRSGWLPLAAGGINSLQNFSVVILASSVLSPSLIYPALAVGGIGINTVASCVLLKERLSVRQWIGLVLGAAAAVLLSV